MKEVFQEEYDSFFEVVTKNQDEVLLIDPAPIDNYENSLIKEEDNNLLKYFYQNIKYYLEKNGTYTPKLQEGFAVLASKVAVMCSSSSVVLNNYFIFAPL